VLSRPLDERQQSWLLVSVNRRRRRRSDVLEGECNSELVHHKPTTHAPSEKEKTTTTQIKP